jgi:hypothetical protein
MELYRPPPSTGQTAVKIKGEQGNRGTGEQGNRGKGERVRGKGEEERVDLESDRIDILKCSQSPSVLTVLSLSPQCPSCQRFKSEVQFNTIVKGIDCVRRSAMFMRKR